MDKGFVISSLKRSFIWSQVNAIDKTGKLKFLTWNQMIILSHWSKSIKQITLGSLLSLEISFEIHVLRKNKIGATSMIDRSNDPLSN